MQTTGTAARICAALLALLGGATLLVLSWPRLDAALPRIMPYGVIADLATEAPVPQAEVDRAARRLADEVARRPDAAALGGLAALRLHAALAAGLAGADGRRLLVESRDLQARALALRPADGYGWFRLAQATVLTDGIGPAAAGYLDMSLRRYPAAGSMLLPRLDLALLLWRALPDEARNRVAAQIRLAAAGNFWRKRALVNIVRRRFALPRVRAALRSEPALAAEFEHFYLLWSRS